MQGSVLIAILGALKRIRTISNIANMLLDLKINNNQPATNIMKAMAPLIQAYTNSVPIMGHVNSTIEQNRRNHFAGCSDSQYRGLSKYVTPGSEWLFGDNMTKRVTTATTKMKLLNNKSTSFTTSSFSLCKNLKFF